MGTKGNGNGRKSPAPPLTVEQWPIERVIPYARNPRKNAGAVAKVAASLKEFGWRQPLVVDKERVLIVGHTRLLAARELGMKTVPVHVAKDMSPTKAKAYRLADNRTAEEAEWDTPLLSLELGELRGLEFDLSLTGFDPTEIAAFTATDVPQEPEDVDLTPPKKPNSERGHVYQIGRHRVMCGDSTSADDVRTLASGCIAEVLWTDPPYGVDYIGKTKNALTIENDGAEGIESLLNRAFTAVDAVLAPSARFYVAAPAGPLNLTFRLAILQAGWRLHEGLVWVKDTMVLGHSDYHLRHEDILYGWKPGPGRAGRGDHTGTRWYGDHSQTSVFEIPRPKRSEEHPTMKPPELVRQCLANSAKQDDGVWDAFAGSGTTVIAAEQLGLSAFLMELSPSFTDVIRRRYAEFVNDPTLAP